MLIPLGPADLGDGLLQDTYTCRHHDAATGDCRIYADRPRMCRNYPDGRACEHSECTAENRGARDGLVQLRVEREPALAAAEVSAETMGRPSQARAPNHRPGARRPGHKAPPPVPSWRAIGSAAWRGGRGR